MAGRARSVRTQCTAIGAQNQISDYIITEHGAVGDGARNNGPAVQRAIDACARAAGGRVVVPAGDFLCGPFDLKDRVELHLSAGARLIASTDPADYEGRARGQRAFIGAYEARDMAITGLGEINGRGVEWMAEEGPYIYTKRPGLARPRMFLPIGCRGVTLRGVTFRDAPVWTVHLAGCHDVLISGVRILNNLKIPNNDAIDVDSCKNVRIIGCHIEAGDDCICLKTTPESAQRYGACEDITVTACTLMSTSAALIIGCEAKAPMRNVIFDSCVVRSSHRGLAIHLSHECDVENVIFSNMVVETRIFQPKWWGRGEPIYVSALPWTKDDRVGRVRHVRFSNVLCRSENGAFVYGWTPDRIEDIIFDGVRIELGKWSRWPAGQHDIRPFPEDSGGDGPVGCGVYDHPTAGFFLKNARDVVLRNCSVAWGEPRQQAWRHAVEAHGIENLRLEGFRGEAAWPERDAAILADDAQEAP